MSASSRYYSDDTDSKGTSSVGSAIIINTKGKSILRIYISSAIILITAAVATKAAVIATDSQQHRHHNDITGAMGRGSNSPQTI